MNYKQKTRLLILVASIVRCIIAFSINLGNDEVYYRMYAQTLQWNYFDHPPMVGWLIRLTTANLYFDNDFFIRVGAIISAAIGTWLLFLCGKIIRDEKTGLLASLIYTSTIYGSIIAGTFILPDSPQVVFWLFGLYFLLKITYNKVIDYNTKIALIYFGIVTGVGMLCKIHTAFLWIGFIMYLLFFNREWFKQPLLYISGLITILIFFPVILWNFEHDFVTYTFHSKRVTLDGNGLNFNHFFPFAFGQLFYFNIVIFPFYIFAIIKAFKNNLLISINHKAILLFTSLPLVFIAFALSFSREVLPHWTGPAYFGIILLTAVYFTNRVDTQNENDLTIPKPIKFSLYFISSILVIGVICINYFPGTLGKKDKGEFGNGDFTLDLYGWDQIKQPFQQIVLNDIQKGAINKDPIIICNKWFPAAHLDHYVAIPLKMDLIAIGDTNDIHQYIWLNQDRKKLKKGNDAYCLVPSDRSIDVMGKYASLFQTITITDTIEIKRSNKKCRSIFIYKLRNYNY